MTQSLHTVSSGSNIHKVSYCSSLCVYYCLKPKGCWNAFQILKPLLATSPTEASAIFWWQWHPHMWASQEYIVNGQSCGVGPAFLAADSCSLAIFAQ